MSVSTYRLREVEPTFWRLFGVAFSIAVISILTGLVIAAAALSILWLALALAEYGLDLEALFLVAYPATWIVGGASVLLVSLASIVRLKFRFGGARLAFVRESLLDRSRASNENLQPPK